MGFGAFFFELVEDFRELLSCLCMSMFERGYEERDKVCLKLFSFCEELSLRVLVGSRMFGIIFISYFPLDLETNFICWKYLGRSL